MSKARAERNLRYLAGVTVATDMLRNGLIDEADYSALETEFAAKFQPLFRCEKPCLLPTLPITQTDDGSGFAAPDAEDNPQGSAGVYPAKRKAL